MTDIRLDIVRNGTRNIIINSGGVGGRQGVDGITGPAGVTGPAGPIFDWPNKIDPFDEESLYVEGDIVHEDGWYWRAPGSVGTGTFDENEWQKVGLANVQHIRTGEEGAYEWTNDTAYPMGSLTKHNRIIWAAKEDIAVAEEITLLSNSAVNGEDTGMAFDTTELQDGDRIFFAFIIPDDETAFNPFLDSENYVGSWSTSSWSENGHMFINGSLTINSETPGEVSFTWSETDVEYAALTWIIRGGAEDIDVNTNVSTDAGDDLRFYFRNEAKGSFLIGAIGYGTDDLPYQIGGYDNVEQTAVDSENPSYISKGATFSTWEEDDYSENWAVGDGTRPVWSITIGVPNGTFDSEKWNALIELPEKLGHLQDVDAEPDNDEDHGRILAWDGDKYDLAYPTRTFFGNVDFDEENIDTEIINAIYNNYYSYSIAEGDVFVDLSTGNAFYAREKVNGDWTWRRWVRSDLNFTRGIVYRGQYEDSVEITFDSQRLPAEFGLEADNYQFVEDENESAGTQYAFTFDPISNLGSEYLSLRFNSAPGDVVVDYAIEAGTGDRIRMYLDDDSGWDIFLDEYGTGEPSIGWGQATHSSVGGANQYLEIQYSKDGSGSYGYDNIRIAKITLPGPMYVKNDLVARNDIYWLCQVDNPTTAPGDSTDSNPEWEFWGRRPDSIPRTDDSVEWQEAPSYDRQDAVIHEGRIWSANRDIAENTPWSESDWDFRAMVSELGHVETKLDGYLITGTYVRGSILQQPDALYAAKDDLASQSTVTIPTSNLDVSSAGLYTFDTTLLEVGDTIVFVVMGNGDFQDPIANFGTDTDWASEDGIKNIYGVSSYVLVTTINEETPETLSIALDGPYSTVFGSFVVRGGSGVSNVNFDYYDSGSALGPDFTLSNDGSGVSMVLCSGIGTMPGSLTGADSGAAYNLGTLDMNGYGARLDVFNLIDSDSIPTPDYDLSSFSGTTIIVSYTMENPSFDNTEWNKLIDFTTLPYPDLTGIESDIDGLQEDVLAIENTLPNKADLVEGVVPTSQIPSLAINDTFVVADEEEMLELAAETGDIAIRVDLNRTFVLQGDDPSVLGDWVMLSGGSDVVSVNGQTGIIVLGPSDVGAAAASHTHGVADITDISTTYAALASANTFTNGQKIQNGGLSLIVGADSSAATLTNSAAKYARLGVPHYTTGEEPLALITGISENGSNELRVGGGTSLMNAATAITLYTANGGAITTGTPRLTIGPTGVITAYGQTVVDGSADAVQLRIQGHSSQTANILEARNYLDIALASISAAGLGTFAGVTSVGKTIAQASGAASGMNGASLLVGADDFATTLTNATAKNGMIAIPHYTNSEEPVALIRGSSDGTTNSIWLGGGPSSTNGATVIRFFTAASAATTTVSEGLRIDNTEITAYKPIIGSAGLTVSAGYDINASHAAGESNTRYGIAALNPLASGTSNVAFGTRTLAGITTGLSNTAMGYEAGRLGTTTRYLTAVGQQAFRTGSGWGNTGIGHQVGFNATGGYNSGIGYLSLVALVGGTNNIAIGAYSGQYSTSQSNELFINSLNRTDRAGDVAKSIIYGVQDADASLQTLALNAKVSTTYKLSTAASTTTQSGLNIPHGTAPSSPVDGDIWTTTSALYARINGLTRRLASIEDEDTVIGMRIFG